MMRRPVGFFNTLVETLSLGGRYVALTLPSRRMPRRMTPAQPHLLLMAWALPPASSAGVYRPLSFMQHAPAFGWRISAVCGVPAENQRQRGEELVARIPTEVRMLHVAESTLQPSYRLSPQIDGGFKNAVAFAEAAIAAFADDRPDVIVASGPPFFVFVAAMLTARSLHVPLVLDYRDEWTQCPFDFVSHGPDDVRWERRCLAAAKAVVFTTESHRRHQLAVFRELDASRTSVVPNGWEEDDFDGDSTHSFAKPHDDGSRPIVLSHIGTLAGHTPPDALLHTIEKLVAQAPEWQARLRLQLIGRRSPQAQAAVDRFAHREMLRIVDHVGKRDAIRLMQQADVLLLISTPDLERYLPGKLFDYVAARRPILVFGEAGEASNVIDSLGCGALCPPDSPQTLAEALTRLVRLHTDVPSERIDTWLDSHRRRHLAGAFFSLVDRVRLESYAPTP